MRKNQGNSEPTDSATDLLLEDRSSNRRRNTQYNGVFALILINLVIFIADHILSLNLQGLYLNHARPAFYQFFTAMFCHASWAHLSGNLFFLYIFGRLVEEEEGIFGVVASYIICGLGASLMSWLFQHGPIYSLGASGAVFGLFAVSVLIKLSWNWRKVLEVLILGQFVIERVFFEFQQTGIQDGVDHFAHLGGAVVGVALIMGLMRLDPTRFGKT
ncbi:rhomboid family intramembrane serine protease [Coleofasciculus sp. FACHB-64]|uniref:rhomboid family intramembrane serine protease n=1 Tax=Cyanophyceae TaxID=3028117 RepID=UPI0016855C27|nr:rhomboid family intramembrane serine protease [Coleofasciculus sp. FACHB-64]MBD2047806.1 rhomboid family intramembrane serine protease [Coleofasciculus sp. FACHB-64]